ncbi:gallerimycin-like [Epargyreus clarus]|uniref:gallerimycin-like n=1 Tax=Epargyreus clarus TaxID=520877 RepID=UPI003C2D67C1
MKACLVIAILFAALAFVAATESEEKENFNLVRNVRSPETIFVKPPPGCVFFECIPSCKQRGYRRGGYCTINGCVCLK